MIPSYLSIIYLLTYTYNIFSINSLLCNRRAAVDSDSSLYNIYIYNRYLHT